jgi:hypothetical protein
MDSCFGNWKLSGTRDTQALCAPHNRRQPLHTCDDEWLLGVDQVVDHCLSFLPRATQTPGRSGPKRVLSPVPWNDSRRSSFFFGFPCYERCEISPYRPCDLGIGLFCTAPALTPWPLNRWNDPGRWSGPWPRPSGQGAK